MQLKLFVVEKILMPKCFQILVLLLVVEWYKMVITPKFTLCVQRQKIFLTVQFFLYRIGPKNYLAYNIKKNLSFEVRVSALCVLFWSDAVTMAIHMYNLYILLSFFLALRSWRKYIRTALGKERSQKPLSAHNRRQRWRRYVAFWYKHHQM